MSTLFPIQKGSKKTLKWVLISFIVITASLAFGWHFGTKNKSFLKYSDQDYYIPNGFTNRVNSMLDSALLDTQSVKYNLDSVNFFYNRLKFCVSYDSIDILGTLKFRLDTFICKTEEDKKFYYNSYLKSVIEAQRQHPEREYFHIFFDRKDSFKIKKISIDPSLYKLKLSNDSWEGSISYTDPFAQIDQNAIFLVFQKSILPVFASSDYSKGEDKFVLLYNNDIFKDDETDRESFSVTKDLIKLYKELSTDAKPLRIYFGNHSSANAIIKNQTNSCALEFNNVDSGFIYFKDSALTIYNGRVNIIPNTNLPVKIEFKQRQTTYNFIVTRNSPLLIASAPETFPGSQLRLHPDSSFTDLYCRQFISTLENGLSTKTPAQNISISLNPLVSKYLESEMKRYVNEIKRTQHSNNADTIQMSICIVDNRTGEIIAEPFYSTQFDNLDDVVLSNVQNFNLTKHFIGSTFKPLLANAASIKFPSLEHFTLSVNDDITYLHAQENDCKILGYPIHPFTHGLGYSKVTGKPEPLFWGGYNNIPRLQFLRLSHDLYPIELGMLALTEDDDQPAFQILNNRNITLGLANVKNLYQLNQNGNIGKLVVKNNATYLNEDMAHSSLFDLMSRLYNVYLINTFDSEAVRWEYHFDRSFLPNKFKLSYAETILPEVTSFNANILGADSSNQFTDFSSWVLGQGKNEWTNLKLSEAYARLFTKRNVHLSYWDDNKNQDNFLFPLISVNTDSLFNPFYQIHNSQDDVNTSWHNLLADFEHAQDDSSKLLRGPSDTLRIANRYLRDNLGLNASRLIIVGKTGTPDNYSRPIKYINKASAKILIYDEGLYVFGLMDSTDYNTNTPSGITCVIFIRRISKDTGLLKPGAPSIGSKDARNFLKASILENLILMNKNRLSVN